MKLLLLAFFLGLTSLFAQKTTTLMDLSGTVDEIITVFDWHGRGMIVLRTNTPKQYQLAYFPEYNTNPAKSWKTNIDKHVRTNLPLIPNDQAEKGILNRIWSYGFTPKHAFFVEHFQNALYVHIIDTAGTVKSSVITPVPNRPNLKTKVFATNQEQIVVALLKESGLPEEAYSVNDNGEFKKLPDFPTEKAKHIEGKIHLDSVSIRPKLALHYHCVNENSVQYIEQGIEKNSVKTVTLNLPPVKDGKYWTEKPIWMVKNRFVANGFDFGIPAEIQNKSGYQILMTDTLGKIIASSFVAVDCIGWNKNGLIRVSSMPKADAFPAFLNEAVISVWGEKCYYVSFSRNSERWSASCVELHREKPVYETLEMNSHRPTLGYYLTRSEDTNAYHGFTYVNGLTYKLTPDRKKLLLYQE
jgi:hypothetical protein